MHSKVKASFGLAAVVAAAVLTWMIAQSLAADVKPADVTFDLTSVKDGAWSSAETWRPARAPKAGDRVLVARGTRVVYDAQSDDVVRMVQVVGTLTFSRERSTLLNVGILKVQNSDTCSESGFACDFHSTSNDGEPYAAPNGPTPALEIGTLAEPIPAGITARVRLHYLAGMNKNDAPALACCSARMDIHGSPLARTWVDLAADAGPGDAQVSLVEDARDWRVGDEVLITGSLHHNSFEGRFRKEPSLLDSETRRIVAIDGRRLSLDRPLARSHFGTGHTRSEVANLSRNVVIESATPDGVRGHTVYHKFSQGGISYARFAHLGKEGVLGRYAIHFHLLGDTNRGGQVLGAAIVDSHNRWITIHGTNYMVVRDCVGYGSVGHGFFLEDGTEVYAVLDRNLGVQAYRGKPLPRQVLPFDPNDGAAFWWANGRNTLVRNVSCENDEYGFRYDSQKRSNFDSDLPVLMPDGEERVVDIRTLPIYRFENNEAHSEGVYGMVVAGTDRAAPDTRHPHVLKNLNIWQVHYGLRPQVPSMWIENVSIDHGVYGIYRPEFENHVYRNLRIAHTGSEPFNRGQDDDSVQNGSITVENLSFEGIDGDGLPLVQLSDNNPSGTAQSHFRGVEVSQVRADRRPRAWFDRGGGQVVPPTTDHGVPVFLHDHFGPGRHARIESTQAKDFSERRDAFRSEKPLTGDEAQVTEVRDVPFPKLLDPVDDLPPATVITLPARGVPARRSDGSLVVEGTTTDNGRTRRVVVNGIEATDVDYNFHRWRVVLKDVPPGMLELSAHGEDEAGNVESTRHRMNIVVE